MFRSFFRVHIHSLSASTNPLFPPPLLMSRVLVDIYTFSRRVESENQQQSNFSFFIHM